MNSYDRVKDGYKEHNFFRNNFLKTYNKNAYRIAGSIFIFDAQSIRLNILGQLRITSKM